MINFTPKNNINFTSRYVKDVEILKKDYNNEYKPYSAKLVELDVDDDRDNLKILSICKKDEFRSFGQNLYEDLNSYDYNTDKKYCFALVKNTEKDLTDINKDNVLGIYSLYEYNNKKTPLTLPYFMTNDDYSRQYDNPEPVYKNIGKGMFKSITEMFPTKSIYGYSAWSAMGFWEKMGFEHLSERRLVYRADKSKEITDR